MADNKHELEMSEQDSHPTMDDEVHSTPVGEETESTVEEEEGSGETETGSSKTTVLKIDDTDNDCFETSEPSESGREETVEEASESSSDTQPDAADAPGSESDTSPDVPAVEETTAVDEASEDDANLESTSTDNDEESAPEPDDEVAEEDQNDSKDAEFDQDGDTAGKQVVMPTATLIEETDDEIAEFDEDDEGEEFEFTFEIPIDDEMDDGQGSATMVAIATLAVFLAAGVGVGYLIGSARTGSSSTDSVENVLESANVTDDTLDAVVATWTYDGKTHSATAEEAIESQYSLEAVVQEDGSYPAASADTIVAYVQNEILYAEATSRGITVSEAEALAYADDTLGVSTWEEIASTYELTEEQAEEIVTMMAAIEQLYSSVVDAMTTSIPSYPESDADSATYYAYIVDILGDDWDSEAGDWANEDSAYYSYLSECDISEDGATYEDACTAYYAAYTVYYAEYSTLQDQWETFENELFVDAQLTIYGVFA